MQRSTQQGMLDANSELPMSFVASPLVNTNTTTTISTNQGVFHGFLVIANGAGAFNATVYDVSTTAVAGLVSTNAVGVLNSTTAVGATSFQWGGEIVVNNGLVLVTTQGTAGAIKVLYL